MSSGFSVQVESLRAAASTFADEAAHLAQVLTTLQGQLSALGAPWGNDEQGQRWAADYEPHVPKVEDAINLLSRGLGSVNTCLKTTADNHDGCESANVTAVRDGSGV